MTTIVVNPESQCSSWSALAEVTEHESCSNIQALERGGIGLLFSLVVTSDDRLV